MWLPVSKSWTVSISYQVPSEETSQGPRDRGEEGREEGREGEWQGDLLSQVKASLCDEHDCLSLEKNFALHWKEPGRKTDASL